MEKSQLRLNEKRAELKERENEENDEYLDFNFEEVVNVGTVALIFEDTNASIYHAYCGLKQYTLAVFFNAPDKATSSLEHSQSVPKRTNQKKLLSKELNKDLYLIQDFYENLMGLQSTKGAFCKNMMKIISAKCVSQQRAEMLLRNGELSHKKEKYSNAQTEEVLFVFLESYERSIEDDIAERSLNQNSVICEDHLLENFSDMISCFNLLGTNISRHLVVSGDHLIIFLDRLTKILPIFDRNSLEEYGQSKNITNKLIKSHVSNNSQSLCSSQEKPSSNQRETRSISKLKQLTQTQQQYIKNQLEQKDDSIASRIRQRREEGRSKIEEEQMTCSTIEMEENQSQYQTEMIQPEDEDGENHQKGQLNQENGFIGQNNRNKNQKKSNKSRFEKQEERIITEEDNQGFQVQEEKEEQEEDHQKQETEYLSKSEGGDESRILLELSTIYMRLSAFMTASKMNPQRKNKNFRIMQVIESLVECKLSSLFSDICNERDEQPLTYEIISQILNNYRQLKVTIDITETFDIQDLQKLIDGKADVIFNFKDKNLLKLEEIAVQLNQNQHWVRNVSSLEFKADLSRIGDQGTHIIVDILKSIDPLRLQHLIISLRRNSISEIGIAAIAEYIAECLNLKMFRIFFSYNRTRDTGLQGILRSLQNLELLEVLDLRFFDNQITSEGCKGFEYLKDVKFKYIKYLNISLGNNSISDEGCRYLQYFLCNIRNVKQLSIFLESNSISSQGINYLKNVFLRKNQIKYLILHALSNQIKDEGIIQIFNNIGKLTTLHSLEIILNENQLTEAAGVALGNSLKNLVHLTQLILSVRNNKISNKGVNTIGESLKNLRNLESLVLSLTNNSITNDGGVIIGKNLKYLQRLQKLHLVFYENSIDHRSGKAIGEGLKNLTMLNYLILGIGDNNVGDEGAVAIGNCIQYLTKIKIFEIYLQNNEVGINGASAIAKGLTNMKNLKCLVFQIQHSPFGDRPIVELGKSIQNLRQLKSLDVYVERCGISEQGGHALGVGLQNLTNIRVMVIDLDSNHIGPMGGKSLGLALKNMTGLLDLKLYLKKNNIMPEGGTGLFQGLGHLKRLKSLNIDLYKNYTGDSCIALCGQSLTQLKELKNLELSVTYNSLSQVGAQQFAQFFSQCISLNEVYLYMQKNSITSEGAESMGLALSSLKDLQQLKISFGNNHIEDVGIGNIIKGAAQCQQLKVLYLYAYNIGMTGVGCIQIAEELLKMKKLERFEFFPSSNGQITFQNGLKQIASSVIQNSETLQNVLVDNAFWEDNIRPFIIPRIHNQVLSMKVLMYSRMIAPFMHYNPKAIFWDLQLDL